MNKPKYKRHNYTEEEVEWLKENVYGVRHEELARRFNERFGTNVNRYNIRNMLTRRGIKNGLNQSDLTKEMKQFVFDNYKGISNQELADRVNKEFGTNFTTRKFMDFKWANNLQSGYQYQPWLKWQKEHMDETIRQDGYVYIKVGTNWYAKQRWVYEQAYGKLQPGEVLIFKDGDSTNCDLDNLIKVRKSVLCRVSSLLTDDKEINNSLILTGLVLDKIKQKTEVPDNTAGDYNE